MGSKISSISSVNPAIAQHLHIVTYIHFKPSFEPKKIEFLQGYAESTHDAPIAGRRPISKPGDLLGFEPVCHMILQTKTYNI
jgi:hypothetical protein